MPKLEIARAPSIALACALALALPTQSPAQEPAAAAQGAEAPVRISQSELEDRIYASWLGQLVGNIYGLPHENIHIDEPGPDAFPYGYDFLGIPYYQSHFGTTKMTGVMDAYGGAFSDDDTDIEYIYLELMEQVGPNPTYAQIRAAWMAHIDNWVWIANRQALALMHQGYYPPYTGSRALNPEWFQIDPQLINEIWAITAPGMVGYSAEKSAWAAKVSADDWGTEPTIAYGAMFAAAIYEPDVAKLVDIGAAALPADSKFARTIAFIKELHQRYPDDWRAARAELAKRYYLDEKPKSIWSANLNGACAILALLYGDGDFQKTMDLAAAAGFDADNQAATLGALLGMAHGTKAIPHDLLYPVKGWQLPFNDRYLNRSRRDMPSASIRDLAQRTAAIAENQIIALGGRKLEQGEETFFEINPDAQFTPPFEIAPSPPRTLIEGVPFSLTLHSGGSGAHWQALDLPPGLALSKSGTLSGTPDTPGHYRVQLTAEAGGKSLTNSMELIVKGPNLAPSASEILGPGTQADLAPLRDGIAMDGASVESPKAETRLEYFGYRWEKPVTAGSILVTLGRLGENGGWFTSLSPEYLGKDGEWTAIPGLRMLPEPVLHNDKHLRPQYGAYLIEFPPVEATAFRIKALNGGDGDQRYISLSELAVFPQ